MTQQTENRMELDFGEEAYRMRYELSRERLETLSEDAVSVGFSDYFREMTAFVRLCIQVYETLAADEAENRELYAALTEEGYRGSFLNPAYARARLGAEYGSLLSMWAAELRGLIGFAYEKKIKNITILAETYIQIYNLFEQGDLNNAENGAESLLSGAEALPSAAEVREVIYSYLYDYCAEFTEDRLFETLCDTDSFCKRIVMEADLCEPSYLYRFGERVTESERSTAEFMASLPEETVRTMADAYTEAYLRGFRVLGKDLSQKSTVQIDLPLGFERVQRLAIRNFEKAGLCAILPRESGQLVNRRLSGNVRPGLYGAVSKQYEYDHKNDLALFLGDRLRAEKQTALRNAYEHFRKEAKALSGRACVEPFGEAGFHPQEDTGRLSYSEHQSAVLRRMIRERAEIVEQYEPEAETSFTIIAWPRPEIADSKERYAEIFRKIVAINTLDGALWNTGQKVLCDALDQASFVEVKGAGENCTDLRVMLRPLSDPSSETNFENCLADVNVPVGEVFTSPQLSGTDGELHVSRVYLGDYQFENLRLSFRDGRIAAYGCTNFPEPKEGERLIEEVIFHGHRALPVGEFAIGTNTAAYQTAKRYGIFDKLPVLIAEKMGPHFAVGDTCYAHEEDAETYNPDGKRIAAKENACSEKRNSTPEDAYFQVHVDITVPYDEIARITAVHPDGSRTDLIRDGRFVLPGTEFLNQPFEE